MAHTVVGYFRDSGSAQAALQRLEQAGFTPSDVSYVSFDDSGRFSDLLRGKVSAGSGTAQGVAALAIPGLGPVVAAGPLAVALAGASVGGATSGLLRALAGLGVPEEQGQHWADRVKEGGTLVIVRANADVLDRAEQSFSSSGAMEVRRYEQTAQPPETYDPADPHTSAPNYGDEGGSSQWAQTVLRVDEGKVTVAPRTFTRDRDPERLD